MKNKNRVEQYFFQKSFSKLELVFLVLAIISGVVAVFVRGGAPIGLPILLISIIAFCICKSAKIKDAEIDQIQQKIIQDNQITVSDNILEGYELKDTVIQKRKDGRLISPNYYITDIITSPSEKTVFHVYKIDLIKSSVEKLSYCLTETDEVGLIEESVKTNFGIVKMTYLKIDFNCQIPVVLADYKSSQLVEQICKSHEKN